MTRGTKSMGQQRAWEMLVGESEVGLWARPIVRYSGFLFLGLLFLVAWLPSKATLAGLRVLLWGLVYSVYLISLEILYKKAKHLYQTRSLQLFRIHFNLIMIAILTLVAPPTASSYLWFFFAMPLLATLGYFGRSPLLLIVYLEVCVAILIPTLVEGWPTSLDIATMVAKDVILGLLTALLYFFVHLSPRLREENTLLEAATTLIQVLDQKEICQLLADAAKAGVPASDAVVVHILGGENNRTLVPMGSSHVDLTALGQSLMEIGVGIAGHVIQSRETINVPNVNKDDRYHRLSSSFIAFKSLLVAPMYIGDKNVGTVSVNGAKKGAFDGRDKRFLTMLAAQGAMAIANAELYGIRTQRRQQVSDILEASFTFGLNQPLDTLLETIAEEVCRCSGYRMAVVNLVDEASGEIVIGAIAGVPPEGVRKLEGLRIPLDTVMPLLQDEFRISRSYFIRHDRRPEIPDLDRHTFTSDLGERKLGEWHQEDMLVVPIQTQEEQLLGYISVDDPSDRQLPSLDTVQALEVLANVAATAIENARLFEEARQRVAELEELQHTSLQLISSLDLSTVLESIVKSALTLVRATDCHIFLYDEASETFTFGAALWENGRREAVVKVPRRDGLTATVAREGCPIVINDAACHPLFVTPETRKWGVQAIAGFPLKRAGRVLGTLTTAFLEPHTFSREELRVLGLLANQAAIAIENARLFEEIEERRLYLEGVLGAAPDAIVTMDARHRIVEWNAGAERLFGYSREEAIGQDIDDLVTNADTFDEAIGFKQTVMGGKDLPPVEAVRYRKDGSPVDVIMAASPILVADELIGIVAVYTNITNRIRQETRLQDYLSTVTSSLAQHTSLEGLHEFIVEAGCRFLSARDCALFLVSDENSDTPKLVAATASPLCGDRSSAISTAVGAGLGCGLVAYAAETRQSICLLREEVFQHPSWNRELWTRLGWDFDPEHDHSLLATPMCAPDGRLIGILVARDSESREGFTDFDEVLFQTLATDAAAAIERVRGLEKAREDAIRAERARLETDLHEAMNVLATGVRWESEILSDQLSCDDPEAKRTTLERLQAALSRAYADLRDLLEDLRDPTLEQEGLLLALTKRAEIIGSGCISVHAELDKRLPSEIEAILYRVGQEAMSNAVKHSGIAYNSDVEIELHLECSERQVKLWVKDNGEGFDVESTLGLSHKWGLRRLRDILREMGGNLGIDSAPRQGATICATIDLTRRSDAQ